MAVTSYDESLRRLLMHEGGYTNHPSDPGGPTNFGITINPPAIAGADVNAKDNSRRTALIYAVQPAAGKEAGAGTMVKMLLDSGADKKVRDKDGRKARDHCADGSEAAELLR